MADYGHSETDKMLAKLEKRISKEYELAEKQLKKKLDNYLKQFKEADKEKKALVKQGLLSQDDYNKWRFSKMMIGNRWAQMRDIVSQDLANTTLIARKLIGEHMKDEC